MLKLNQQLSILLALLFSIFIFGCNSTTENRSDCIEHQISDCNEDINGINIRIRNDTGHDICNLVLNWNQYQLGELLEGEESCYYFQDIAYRYPSQYQFYIDDESWGAEAIDFIGETPLDPGYYTYEIYVVDELTKSNSVRFIQD